MDFGRITDPNAWKQAMAGLLRRGGEVTDYIATAPEKAGEAILQGHERNKALQAQAFANPDRPFQVTNQEAMGELGDRMLAGPLSVAPVGMTKLIGPQTEALEIAQRNASLPIEQGGLGLPPNNTAMDRAKAMGFDTPAYHGTNADIYAFNPKMADSRRGTGTPMGAVVVSSNPKTASTYAGEKPLEWIKEYQEGGNVIPLLVNKGKNMSMDATQQGYTPNWKEIYNPKYPDVETTNDFAAIAKQMGKQSATIKNVKDNAVMSGAEGNTTFVFDPSLLRSKFAAFDPKRIKDADLLAGVVPLGAISQTEEGKQTRKELLEQLLNKQK